MTTEQDRIEVRRRVCGSGDLSALSVLGGGFIILGYWRDVNRLPSVEAAQHFEDMPGFAQER